jgi:hypothetical protein
MKKWKVVLAALCFAIPLSFAVWNTQVSATVDGTKYADGHATLVLPRINSADTTETIRVTNGIHHEITYQIRVSTRRASGVMAATDTVQLKLCASLDDSNFVNVSSTNDVKTYTTVGTRTLTFDYLGSYPFTRLEIYNMAAADSISVNIKAFISASER